ncbi:MAG: hypothetical protein ABEJ23_02345 [Haloarculaceae archaeon]
MATSVSSDMDVGLGLLFAVVALVGAVTMYLSAGLHDQLLAGWGFALAMFAAGLAIAAMHVYA